MQWLLPEILLTETILRLGLHMETKYHIHLLMTQDVYSLSV